ncbi:endolytic transglycosylase MltG [Candidatus Saccharibacteria bacterium]|nr:endolytic transglycosylase MltG [Candidatus Saccharibacteria bacterium]
MKYRVHRPNTKQRGWLRWALIAVTVLAALALIAAAVLWRTYNEGLKPVGGSGTTSITIEQGESVPDIATKLKTANLIRSEVVFAYYAKFHNASQYLQAGTYDFSPSQGVPEIVAKLTHGKVATSLVTILPGQRLDQIRQSLIDQGFSEADVDAALEPSQYASSPIFAGKPAANNLEGYLYPDSFQKTANTSAKTIVQQSLAEMQQHLTPDILNGFKKQGLDTYQGLIIASIVTKEVTNQDDRAQAAQVFLKRLKNGIALGSDVTAYYGSILAGVGKDVTYDTPYNTRIHTGLPPTPISNVEESALQAVAHPASTDWLFFVTGDDGTTYFSKTVEEHEALAAKYCHKLCQE